MMKKINISAFLMAILAIVIVACQPVEGIGGKAHIHGDVEYNSDHVDGAMVYIWYGERSVTDFDTGYDDQTNSNLDGGFEFEELTKGDYFLYGKWTDNDGVIRTATQAVTIEKKSEEVEAHLDLQ